MKFIIKTLSLAALLINAKQAFAEDDLLSITSRPKLFEMTDFNVPTFKVKINENDYNNLFLVMRCEMDTHPSYLKRNDDCYTAPWVDLNYALKRAYNKNYLDIQAIKNYGKDIDFINSVVEGKAQNITLAEFEDIVNKYSTLTLEEILSQPYNLAPVPSGKPYGNNFETDNASMTFELNGEVTEVPNIKFSVGGRSSKDNSKLSYNINIKNGLLFETKNIRLRADSIDPTYIREKLAYDFHKLFELPTINANYARLYINDEFMGFYILRDAIKPKWIQDNFGEKNTKNIYKCHESAVQLFKCENDDEKITDNSDFEEFIEKLQNVKSREELEEFFDVKTFIRWQAARYLFGSLDHDKGKNTVLYMFHNENKKIWVPLHYDFDMNFGNYKIPNAKRTFTEEIANKSNPLYPIYKLLNLDNNNNEELISIMNDMVTSYYNPFIVFPRIDKIKRFIADYVYEDHTPLEDGHLPGRFAIPRAKGGDFFTYEDFEDNTEFVTIKNTIYVDDISGVTAETIAIGLKHWLIERFKFSCSTYKLNCSYMDSLFNSPYFSEYEVEERSSKYHNGGCKGSGYACCKFNTTTVTTTDYTGKWGIEGLRYCLIDEDAEANKAKEEEKMSTTTKEGNCPTLIRKGYPCCTKKTSNVNYISKNGDQYGYENNKWCGITTIQCPNFGSVRCCEHCKIISSENGHWGIEVINGVEQRCAISNYCLSK
ncbi:hypothetical protein BCR32DRAFT_291187 [Anaeromyces robustus]|uniref:CBM10 domain-containing protein n=1 Tax=Anaeromyces robustus TaxID=1754192 RepID=A0A1Y1XFZ4_9FUNG|nr:hypothetical protein BCR32DRAFT_291187 [Anaeromyces robustus]|eukprot:ORX84647.1 hypothetical protein BCR32DRAFT_291187 [Anaeromyces robustus]